MPRPFRARRIFKWTGAGLTLLILVTWWVSRFTYFGTFGNGWAWMVVGGCWNFHTGPQFRMSDSPDFFQAIGLYLQDRNGLIWPHYESAFNGRVLFMPLWLPFSLIAIPTAWLWHRDRRPISSSPDHWLCLRCGYDLTGNTSGVCPECGDKACPPAGLANSECNAA